MSIIFNLFSIPPLACRLLPVLQFCPILRGSNFGWVLRSGHIFDSFYISPDWISAASLLLYQRIMKSKVEIYRS